MTETVITVLIPTEIIEIVEAEDVQEIVQVVNTVVEVVEIAERGLPGADGGGTPMSETLVISNPNTDEHILTGGVPVTGSVKVFLNGIRETDYSVAVDTVVFDLDLGAGDKLTFDYLTGD